MSRYRTQRRGSVLVMVVGVLAMLFIIGSTQLLVARFEKQSAQQKRASENIRGAAAAGSLPLLLQVRNDIVGNDAIAYNALGQDVPQVEDSSDFSGFISPGDLSNGDLLFSSLEPYLAPDDEFYFYAMSWMEDAVPVGVNAPANYQGPLQLAQPVNGLYGDADGDGVADSLSLAGSFSGAFGGNFDIYQRVISHGGMVQLDATTHPALLAQVIHPLDGTYHNQPWRLFNNWQPTDNDESDLRRRFILPDEVGPNHPEWARLNAYSLRKMLPFTTGYRNNVHDDVTPHWWPVSGGVPKDIDWWEDAMSPPPALTSGSYNSSNDTYDRRHLITTKSNDDLLRPLRDEKGGTPTGGGGATTGLFNPAAITLTDAPLRDLYYTISPGETAGPDVLGFEQQPWYAYGRPYNIQAGGGQDQVDITGDLLFNTPSMRTQFSLRDVLVNPISNGGYQASYRRAMQLTAYYLAMTLNTDGWSTETGAMDPKIVAAAQLAVNTIDFADNYEGSPDDKDPITGFTLTLADGSSATVYGVERQPYLTEAYAKVVIESVESTTVPGTYVWETESGDGTGEPVISEDSIYAIELYNPYDETIDLEDYEIVVGPIGAESGTTVYSLFGMGFEIPAFSYLVIANRLDDVNDPSGPIPMFIPNAQPGVDLVTIPGFEIKENQPVSLTTNNAIVLRADVGADPAPGTVLLDQIEPVNLGGSDTKWAAPADLAVRQPIDANDRLVRDTSLQRRKEWHTTATSLANAEFPPQYWHFTIGQQMLFPLDWHENPANATGSLLATNQDRVPQHNLLSTGTGLAGGIYQSNNATIGSVTNQELAAAAFDGREVELVNDDTPATPLIAATGTAVAQFPVLVSDRGFDDETPNGTSTVGCAAFPTTGTLLLVTRNGPYTYNGLQDTERSLSALTARNVTGGTKPVLTYPDLGHMPVFTYNVNEGMGKSLDWANGWNRLDVPWGRLAFNYFTALPLEELAQLDAGATQFRQDYLTRFSASNLPVYPLVERRNDAPAPFGVSVQGRVNINMAPWWVLDGLPVVPDAVWGTTSAAPFTAGSAIPDGSWSLMAGLPLDALASGRLDPVNYNTVAENRPGQLLLNMLLDNDPTSEGLTSENYPTLGPVMAKLMVSYREQRPVDGWAIANGGNPGFVTMGDLCRMMLIMPLPAGIVDPISGLNPNLPLFYDLKDWYNPGQMPEIADRPFSYVGYLQLMTPIVRLQDWATTKGHVYTIYNLIGEDGVWLRSQTTVDRTRCLYSSELPDRIIQSEMTSYSDASGN